MQNQQHQQNQQYQQHIQYQQVQPQVILHQQAQQQSVPQQIGAGNTQNIRPVTSEDPVW